MKTKKPNIIFITLDALRPKNLGCYGYSRDTSPNIDSLAKEGIKFTNNFASHNMTDRSHLSILSGRHILSQMKSISVTEDEFDLFANSGGTLLQTILKKQGYKTFCLKELYGWHETDFDYFFKWKENESKKWSFIRCIQKVPMVSSIIKYFFHHFAPRRMANNINSKSYSEKTVKEAVDAVAATEQMVLDKFYADK